MNIQHSSRSDQWYTPIDIIERSRRVLGTIDFDPASDAFGNSRVNASIFLTTAGHNLARWPPRTTVFLNPPGGKFGARSKAATFWDVLMEYRKQTLRHAIFLAFSLEQMQTTQSSEKSICDFPFCVPRRRIRFDSPRGDKNSPSHSNVIVYVPGSIDKREQFAAEFRDLGVVRL